MKKQRYLVTGGTGQLGHAVQQQLPGEAISYIKSHESLDINCDRRTMSRITSLKPDAVINCAAYTNVRQAEKEREQAWRTNTQAVHKLAKGLARENIPLIHFSTDFVFGFNATHNHGPFNEDDCIAPCGYYGLTKAMGEHAIWQVAHRYPSWPFYIIRTAGLFELPWRDKRNFPWAIASRLARRQSVSVVNDVWTNITAAEDLAKCVLYVADNREKIPSGCYHVTNHGATTWFDVANLIQREMTGIGRARVSSVTSEEFEKARGCDPNVTAKYTCLSSHKFTELPTQCSGLPQFPKLQTWQQVVERWVSSWRNIS